MAQNTTISVPAATWTQLTDADVSAISFQNTSVTPVRISYTAGATAPTSIAGSYRYNLGQGERNVPLADVAPGVTGANRVWAYAEQNAEVTVSHA